MKPLIPVIAALVVLGSLVLGVSCDTTEPTPQGSQGYRADPYWNAQVRATTQASERLLTLAGEFRDIMGDLEVIDPPPTVTNTPAFPTVTPTPTPVPTPTATPPFPTATPKPTATPEGYVKPPPVDFGFYEGRWIGVGRYAFWLERGVKVGGRIAKERYDCVSLELVMGLALHNETLLREYVEDVAVGPTQLRGLVADYNWDYYWASLYHGLLEGLTTGFANRC